MEGGADFDPNTWHNSGGAGADVPAAGIDPAFDDPHYDPQGSDEDADLATSLGF